MHEYVGVLKQCFIVAVSKGDSFPYLTSSGWLKFCQESGIADNKGAKISVIDRVFIASD